MTFPLSCRSSVDDGPRTPSSSSSYRPHTSSPLSESFSPSPSTSAAAKLQSRRLAQYKSITTPTTRRVSSAYKSRSRHSAVIDGPNFSGVGHFPSLVAASPGDVENNNHDTARDVLLRDRLRQRCCAHRAQQKHAKRVERERRRRRNALSSSDGEDMDIESEEEEENDEEFGLINDELFRRIIHSARHKQRYSYRLSFQNDVGSSIDPDMDDVAEWERNLQDDGLPEEPDHPLSEFDEEEIAERAAEAEEAALWADFDGDSDTVFGFSDINDVDLMPHAILDEDIDMA